MTKNLGNADRMMRVMAAAVSAVCAVEAPLPLAFRMGVGGMALYLLLTALGGTCLGYRLLGKSTCPTGQRA